jgi:lipopolysaccharide biosynthesis regulator YciM
VLAHTLFRKKEYAAAAKVLKALARADPSHPRTAILLACCQAALSNFAGSHDLLAQAFPGENRSVATRLHEAFIFHRVGMTGDTVEELTVVANQRKDLAVVCLLLGDVFAAAGKQRKAAVCWRLAVQRDGGKGAVAKAARGELKKLKKNA